MRKIAALSLALIMLCMALCSCEAKLFDPVSSDTTAVETTAAPTADPDYDASGNIILTSTENRKVYDRGRDFIIFSFAGDTVKSISRVEEHKSKAEAEEYVKNYVIECNKKGEVPPVFSVNGVYVITKIGFSNERGSDGFYYSMLKEKIMESMENNGAVLQ